MGFWNWGPNNNSIVPIPEFHQKYPKKLHYSTIKTSLFLSASMFKPKQAFCLISILLKDNK